MASMASFALKAGLHFLRVLDIVPHLRHRRVVSSFSRPPQFLGKWTQKKASHFWEALSLSSALGVSYTTHRSKRGEQAGLPFRLCNPR